MVATKTTTSVELYTARAALEKIHSAPGFHPFPEGTAFYLTIAGAAVRIDRDTAATLFLTFCGSNRLAGMNQDHPAVARFDPKGLTCDIG